MENQKLTVTECGQTSLTENKEKSLKSWIVRASRLKKVSEADETEILAMIAFLMIMVGFKEKPSKAEAIVLVDYIKSRLSRFSIEEFKVAYTLFVEGKLDIDREHYNAFSTIYLGRVMDSYGRYRFQHLKDAELEVQADQDEKPQVNIENLIISQFERFLAHKEIHDYGSIQYRYLSQIGLIDLTRDQKMEIMLQAKQIHELQNTSLVGCVITSKNDDIAIVAMAQLLALRNYFETLKKSKQHIAVIFKNIHDENS